MAITGTVLGFSALGFATRCMGLGIQKRNMFENFGGHAILMGLFGAAGYYLHGVEFRQREIIEKQKATIRENRKRLAGVVQARAAESRRAKEEASAGKEGEE
ncbi:unnamed protein product [Tilletia controversa]|uniref:Uncharacterized protein n=3 Tax=Tilletia TaxID=13289 RepID=A0A8X7MSS6_9BASI|nr:hypothetical protein CF336_g4587 [Tilletia laevis]KAE8197291.1 hypothetical protein CF328_g3898 [Tilletia controversa]KAE8261596.1 hypothetical protein A4X03_0g3121 [Tilletia caries]KAE8200930.1 hypothetical protein CF335_g3848 [Tilletia laevis]KAE8246463.1 hypothetical protein A4X06_0g5004 [Tilletia controversa]